MLNTTLKELIEHIRNNPGKISLSTGAPNSMQSIAMFMLKDQEKLDFKLVPFGDGAQSIVATLGRHTDGFVGVDEAIPHIREGRMRLLATLMSERLPEFSYAPTLKEAGYDVAVESRPCLYGPPGVPKEVAKKLENTFRAAMDSDEFKKICQTFNLIPSFLNGEQMTRYHRDLQVKLKYILIITGDIKE